ncbi:phage tail protein [Hafnia paralvei]|uniref:phage head-tail joining protein n=1 Tax=Hafnia TaxID=568 RepID=UPI000DF944BF|nr:MULTISPECIES: gpW family head-tail joining protein [Hafnia]TBL99893.1 phage tail protein [Hafnia paralvei]STQ68394.1 gpW [Hafnia alvei]
MSLENDLAAAQRALHDLLIGKRVVSVQKDGRKVDFTSASLDQLQNYIDNLKGQLGQYSRRRPPSGGVL